jgi:hypothetical protein
MKKICTLFFAAVCAMSLTLNAQILNPGFEDWAGGNPVDWATSNAFPASLVNITQTTDANTGMYAVDGIVIELQGTPYGPVIQSGTDATGFPVTEKYQSLTLYYKFKSVEGDKFSVNVALERGGVPIAQGAVAIPTDVDVYKTVTVPLDYTTNEVPDRAYIQISITGPETGNDVHIGSEMIVDDLSFSLTTGNAVIPTPVRDLTCYPNPATEFVKISLDKAITGNSTLLVSDTYGREVKKMENLSLQPGKKALEVSVLDLPSGIYFFTLTSQTRNYSGKFMIVR